MELATTLKSQAVRAGVRQVGINPDYWYPVGWSHQLKPGQVIPVVAWNQEIAVYRDTSGRLHALEDACPHKGVALHKGKVIGENLACRYHGWEFGDGGQCVNIPYLPKSQKLPPACARTFPIQEKYDLIWVFPGNPDLAEERQPPEVAEYAQPGWLDVSVTAHFNSHFSICNENSMDVFHGFLHENLQGWFDPVLLKLQETESTVSAQYQVSYKGQIAKFLGLTDRADQVTTLPVTVEYRYPHYYSTLEGVSSLYLMRLPVSSVESRSFALFFFRVRLPQWVLTPLRPVLRSLLRRFVLHRFLAQDIEMMESEQQHYLANPNRKYIEINPAIIAVQRLIVRQYDLFRQASSQSNGHKSSQEVVYRSMAATSSDADSGQAVP
ncbi:aromatic ring-hydroxylating dioxygenase subunit alpha [Leptolyngbya sp. FACHB-36]|uniref:aromatic ring-hydroxylating dioxygenase subunit alpha n=1 Tax=Leptolyngbya sp. FACHB-36 TaxID=2692808 RepID=UPI00168164F6|nr:aromatic ring-hydroxylating dioxygenase subunit alpha [Leptolyngbya sp. FACHB-36]MBD2022236.1 aromatic ring-hydroxylating dioxygenase subunit alpha [Leptolyngbya sp. FACHB-36]